MIRSSLGLLAAAAAFSLPVHASTYPNARLASLQAAYGNVLGNATTVVVGTAQGAPLATAPATAGATLGGFSVGQTATGVALDAKVKVPLGNTGKAAGAVASAAVSRGAFLRGLATVLSGPAGMLSIAATAPLVYQWLKSGGILFNDDGVVQGAPGGLPSCTVGFTTGSGGIGCTREEACASVKIPGFSWAGRLHQGGSGTYYCAMAGGTEGDIGGGVPGRYDMIAGPGPLPFNPDPNYPPSMDDIAPYMDRPEAPALTPNVVVEAVTKLGVDPFGAEQPEVKVTGPASLPGEKVQTSTQTRVISGTTTEAGPGYSGDTQPGTRTTTQTATHNVTYNDNRVTYNTTNNTTTTVTNNVTGQSSTTTGESTTEDDAPDDSVTDTPLGDVPKLYERKYPDGMVGIWNQKKVAMQGTSLMAFLTSVMPTGMNTGTCPAWTLDVNFGGVLNMGSYPVEVPCWLWGVVKAALIVSALLYARRLIFGG